jgi:hypothetical protein
MVDPSDPDQLARLGNIVGIDVHPKQASTLMHAAKALGWTGIARFLASRSERPKLRTEAETKKVDDAMDRKFAPVLLSLGESTAPLVHGTIPRSFQSPTDHFAEAQSVAQ